MRDKWHRLCHMTAVTVTRTATVPASPDAVWATLADLDAISAWAGNVDHSAVTTEATEGVGAARRVQAGRVVLIETVTVWEAPTRLAYTLDGLPPLARTVTNRWDLAPAPGDTTAVTLTTTIEPLGGPRGRIGQRILGRVLAKAADDLVTGLVAHDHSAPGGTSA